MLEPLSAPLAEVDSPRPRQPLFSRRYTLEIRQQLAWPWQALILGLALLLGLGLSAAILVLAGVPAGELLNEFVIATLFDAQSLQATLFQAAPVIRWAWPVVWPFARASGIWGWKAR